MCLHSTNRISVGQFQPRGYELFPAGEEGSPFPRPRAAAFPLGIPKVIRTRIVAVPFCNLWLKAGKPRCKVYPERILILGDAVRKPLLDLGCSQKDVAAILQVYEYVVRKRRTCDEN